MNKRAWNMIETLRTSGPRITRVLVTGGREFSDVRFLDTNLALVHLQLMFRVLIHGGARGTDSLAHSWAVQNGIQPCACEALWNFYKSRGQWKAAGPIRNGAMLLLEPQLVIAFPGGDGTANMVEQAIKAYIPVCDLRDGGGLL